MHKSRKAARDFPALPSNSDDSQSTRQRGEWGNTKSNLHPTKVNEMHTNTNGSTHIISSANAASARLDHFLEP